MKYHTILPILFICFSCGQKKEVPQKEMSQISNTVKLMTLDPGHFHAALVQKSMYPQVDSTIYVYAPEGPEVKDFLEKIKAYNSRTDFPTAWKVETQLGNDFLKEMLIQKPGNVMIVAGKNSKKIDYVLEAVKAGLNVYADKPLVIDPEGFEKLKKAFQIAEENGVLIYDIMTERFETTTLMQKLFSSMPDIFGELSNGTPEAPAISKESVHHFFKYVSGQPLVRPPWFFDVKEEGEGIVDVTTHLVDLVQWEAFPEQIIDTTDIKLISARRWPTVLTKAEFQKVTGLNDYPEYLDNDIINKKLNVYCNGEIIYKIKDKYAKVSVIWNFQAPEGTGDTHYSIMRGSKCNLIIKQGKEEGYKPILYIESMSDKDMEKDIQLALTNDKFEPFAGTNVEKISDNLYKINIPDTYKIGHEEHFAQVTQNYLNYLEVGKLPIWEVPNMISKYYTTTHAYKMSMDHR